MGRKVLVGGRLLSSEVVLGLHFNCGHLLRRLLLLLLLILVRKNLVLILILRDLLLCSNLKDRYHGKRLDVLDWLD